MLDDSYAKKLSLLLAQLPCLVEIPERRKTELSIEGVLPSFDGDKRRFARRRALSKAICKLTDKLPTIERDDQFRVVLTYDISRGGVSFLHFEQLFPCEGGQLWFSDNRQSFEVVRCRRWGPRCFQVSGSFTD